MSVFLDRNHLFLRSSRGGVEDVASMSAAGFTAIFCNIDPNACAPEDWDLVRDRAQSLGVVCGPWLRTADAHGEFDAGRLDLLIDVADAWGWTPLIVNSEKEIDHTGDDVTGFIAEQVGDRDAAISVEVRPFGAVDWRPLARYPILPQSFPAETGIADPDDVIRANWWAAGVQCVVVTYGTYGGMQPDEFARLTPYGLYTADDCGNQFARWSPVGSTEPCSTVPPDANGGDMETIGTQHGVTSALNRLRTLDPGGTILSVDAQGKWAPLSTLSGVPLDKWKAWDKLERTLTILVQDHDGAAV
jgi:hypothetical protein